MWGVDRERSECARPMGVGDHLPLSWFPWAARFPPRSVTESLTIGLPGIRVLKSLRVFTADEGNQLPQGTRLVDSGFELGPIRRALGCGLQEKSVWM